MKIYVKAGRINTHSTANTGIPSRTRGTAKVKAHKSANEKLLGTDTCVQWDLVASGIFIIIKVFLIFVFCRILS